MLDAGPCVVWVAGAGADYASTRYALREGASVGAREGNPVQGQGALRQAAVQAGVAGVGCWVDSKLRREGKPKLARALRIGVLAVKLYLVAHNVRAGRGAGAGR